MPHKSRARRGQPSDATNLAILRAATQALSTWDDSNWDEWEHIINQRIHDRDRVRIIDLVVDRFTFLKDAAYAAGYRAGRAAARQRTRLRLERKEAA